MIGFFILALVAIPAILFAYVLAELQHYARGNDVYGWTVHLAKFLKARK